MDHSHDTESAVVGSCLEHGHAHAEHHKQWSRRDFLRMAGIGMGGAFMLGATPVSTYASSPLLQQLGALATDRVLVLIQLNGGNDGLNMVVPYTNDLYYTNRPQIALAKNNVWQAAPDAGFHPGLRPLEPLFAEGKMAVLRNVGYPSPDLSHFRATDIWVSASRSDQNLPTGWAGRYLDEAYPNFLSEQPAAPLAVQLGGASTMMLQGPDAFMGMTMSSPEMFDRVAARGLFYGMEGLPNHTAGDEMRFVRTVANSSYKYAGAVQQAGKAGVNAVAYPTTNSLFNNLAIIARLIKGKLGSRIYHLSLGGFDTHANQLGTHAGLMDVLGRGVRAFYDDLAAHGLADQALVMTFSEFGRRVKQNGSNGTDHGTAAPLFVFGGGVEGGMIGKAPDLADLDRSGNIKYETDFRSAYATILQNWFGLPAANVAMLLGGSFTTLPFVQAPAAPTAAEEDALPRQFALHGNYPNPFNPTTLIQYSLAAAGDVRLEVFDVQGRRVRTLVDEAQTSGRHEVLFEAHDLASGTYLYRLQTPFGVQTRKMALVK